jgi:hypothetical protein
MIRCVWLLMVPALTLGLAGAKADDAYTIKLKEGAAGGRTQVEKESTEKSNLKVEDRQGKVLQSRDENKTEKFAYQETILEKEAGKQKPTRLKRHYDVATVKSGDDSHTLPYQGKDVLIEKKGDSYHFQIEGAGELTGKDAESLEKEFNREKGEGIDIRKIVVPKKPVRVQESWTLDSDALIKDLEKQSPLDIDAAKAKATATLQKAYMRDGRQFGIIAIHLDFPIKGMKMGGMTTPLTEPAPMLIDATMDVCIDGSQISETSESKQRMQGVAEIAQGGMKFKITFSASGNLTESEKEIPKK